MSVLAGAIAAGVANAGTNIGSTIYSTERNISSAAYQAQLQRDFEKRMASTQYQRAVADMEQAGLNPAAIGAGMSSNAVPNAQAATGNYGHTVATDFSNIFSSAVSAAMARDKNVTNKIMQEMQDETALQVQNLRNQGRLEEEKQRGNNYQYLELAKKGWGHRSYLSPEELRKLYRK